MVELIEHNRTDEQYIITLLVRSGVDEGVGAGVAVLIT